MRTEFLLFWSPFLQNSSIIPFFEILGAEYLVMYKLSHKTNSVSIEIEIEIGFRLSFTILLFENTGCPRIKFTSCTQFYKAYKEQITTKIFMSMDVRQHFWEIFRNSLLNLFPSLRHPIPGSFFVHWAKEDKFLLLTFQKLLPK